MKTLGITLAIFLTSLVAFGQKKESDKDAMQQRMEQLKAEKVAYFTEKIQLDSETAQKFWPMYNEYEAEKMRGHHQYRELMWKYYKEKKEGKSMTDKEYLDMADAMVNAKVQQAELDKRYHGKFKEILTPEQLVNYYRADEQFGREMIKRFRSDRAKRGGEKTPK